MPSADNLNHGGGRASSPERSRGVSTAIAERLAEAGRRFAAALRALDPDPK